MRNGVAATGSEGDSAGPARRNPQGGPASAARAALAKLAAMLTNARRVRGLSQRAVSKRMGIGGSAGSLCQWETGTKRPRGEHLIGWAAALGYDIVLQPQVAGETSVRNGGMDLGRVRKAEDVELVMRLSGSAGVAGARAAGRAEVVESPALEAAREEFWRTLDPDGFGLAAGGCWGSEELDAALASAAQLLIAASRYVAAKEIAAHCDERARVFTEQRDAGVLPEFSNALAVAWEAAGRAARRYGKEDTGA